MTFSRRGFVQRLGAAAATLGYVAGRQAEAIAQTAARPSPVVLSEAMTKRVAEYDAAVKLASNENPWGPLDSVKQAMNDAWKYSFRYGYPDGGILQAIADHHGVSPQHILLGAGSGEILDVAGWTFLKDGGKVLGFEPTYNSVFAQATTLKTDAIRLQLSKDYSQSIPVLVAAARRHHRQLGFVYLCNPNNPTGMIVTKSEIKQLLDGIPEDLPVLIDEAYFHYAEHPDYATSLPYVLEGRRVIIARTFSKIFGIAAMRLGYAIAPPDMIESMRPYSAGSINALVKWGGVAGLQDTAGQQRVKDRTLQIKKRTVASIKSLGYEVLPSEANYFMIGIRRDVPPVIEEFRKRGVLVGRPFPPMLQHLRVSVGSDEEMDRFLAAFKEIFPATRTAVG
jgi:histidinol-phosphate aminotransferase